LGFLRRRSCRRWQVMTQDGPKDGPKGCLRTAHHPARHEPHRRLFQSRAGIRGRPGAIAGSWAMVSASRPRNKCP